MTFLLFSRIFLIIPWAECFANFHPKLFSFVKFFLLATIHKLKHVSTFVSRGCLRLDAVENSQSPIRMDESVRVT
jgi:hypothetical protein